jgi:hypothetical protein
MASAAPPMCVTCSARRALGTVSIDIDQIRQPVERDGVKPGVLKLRRLFAHDLAARRQVHHRRAAGAVGENAVPECR